MNSWPRTPPPRIPPRPRLSRKGWNRPSRAALVWLAHLARCEPCRAGTYCPDGKGLAKAAAA